MRLTYTIDNFDGNGHGVNLLMSVTVSYAAKRRGIELVCEDSTDTEQAIRFWLKVVYAAALNYWDMLALTDPKLGDFPYTIIDFAVWQSEHVAEYVEVQKWMAQAMAGLNNGKTSNDVKKK